MPIKPGNHRGSLDTEANAEREDYHDLLLRFREFLAGRGRTFQDGMRSAIAVEMGERPKFPSEPKQGRRHGTQGKQRK
jgi:hypothetical protein